MKGRRQLAARQGGRDLRMEVNEHVYRTMIRVRRAALGVSPTPANRASSGVAPRGGPLATPGGDTATIYVVDDQDLLDAVRRALATTSEWDQSPVPEPPEESNL